MPSERSSAKSERQAVLALDLGGTKLASGLFARDAQPTLNRVVPLEGRTGAAVGDMILREIRRLRRAATRRGVAIRAIGFSVPGIVNQRSGRVWAPNIPGWDDYPLGQEIKQAIADVDVKLIVESDRTASILGETWQGAARGCRNAIFLAVGTGIGAGILVDRRVLRGAHGIAGAIGWLALNRPFKPEYESCGCFESHASGEGLAKVAKAILARRKNYRGSLRGERDLTAHHLFDAYDRGDEVAVEVISQAIEFWGMASANLVSLFNPEKIIFGGGVFGPAGRFLEAIAAEARRWAQPVSMTNVSFEASQLGSDAALYGAGYLALRRARLIPGGTPRAAANGRGNSSRDKPRPSPDAQERATRA